MSARDELVTESTSLLNEMGFEVSDICNIRPKSFDLVARRGRLVLLVKTLVNIDSLDGETAYEMKVLSEHLGASPLILGAKSRDYELEDGVLYLRHGVPAVTLGTAYDYFVEGVPPLAYMGSGGLYVSIDGDLLADLRESEDMSLGQIANELGVSRRSVSKYEDGMDATLDVALKLEDIFGESLISPIEIFEEEVFDEEGDEHQEVEMSGREKVVLGLLRSVGYDVLATSKAPFRALSRGDDEPTPPSEDEDPDESETVLTGTSHHSGDVVKRANLMSSISDVARTRSIYILDESESSNRESIEGTVIIGVEELEDIEGSEEFDEVYKEKSS
ncbi:MAG: transcriptional regulator [Halobacteria archaeon]|nr:transcriptional regulator [Halobacteria archaeon]